MEQRLTDLQNALHARFDALETKLLALKWVWVGSGAGFVLGLVLGHLAR